MLDFRLVDEARVLELLARRRIEDFFLHHSVNFQLRARLTYEILLLLGISTLQFLELVEHLPHFAMIFHQQGSRIFHLGVLCWGFGHVRLISDDCSRRAA